MTGRLVGSCSWIPGSVQEGAEIGDFLRLHWLNCIESVPMSGVRDVVTR